MLVIRVTELLTINMCLIIICELVSWWVWVLWLSSAGLLKKCIYEARQFCFVLFVSLRSPSQIIMAFHANLFLSLEMLLMCRVHRRLGLKLFGAPVWKLLIIESFPPWKLNKMKTEKLHWNLGGFLGVVGKPSVS